MDYERDQSHLREKQDYIWKWLNQGWRLQSTQKEYFKSFESFCVFGNHEYYKN